jgi:ankyrin repeat protein
MKFAYLETKRKSKYPGKPVASFFFNARGDTLERSVAGMYRSLLLQLLKTYPDLQVILDDTDVVPSNQTTCPDVNVLKETLRSAVAALGRHSFTCFVDALDECDEQEVRDMVQFFEELAEETTADHIQFRVCFSSRPYPYIDIRPEVLLVLEKEAGHAEDLSRYVESRLKITSPLVLSDLKLRILDKAAGIFMWIVLVVDILNKENENGALALGKRLEEIPSQLSDLFKSILTRDQHQVDRLLLCILWVLCAKRPLSPAEFRHALWAGLLNHGLVDLTLPENTAADAAKLVTSASKGLAEITKSKLPTVQFIHESVRDFLMKENGLRDLWPDLGLEWEAHAHEKLKHCCFTYLSLPDVQAILKRFGGSDKQHEESVPTERYPFLEYASQQVLHHSDAAVVAVPQDDFITWFFSSAGTRWLNLFEENKQWRYSGCATHLYVLADRGFANLVRAQMKREKATRTEERYGHPLFAALAGGHGRAVAALLGLPSIVQNGIDLTAGVKRRNFRLSSRRTPLSWAAQAGRLGLVKALLESGEDINQRDGEYQTPIQRALSNRNLDVAWYLFDSGTNYESSIWRRMLTPLLIEVAKTNDGTRARALVEKGADLHARLDSGNTALHFASRAGSETVTQVLIEKGANLHAQNDSGNIALHIASKAGSEAVVRLLITAGSKIHHENNAKETALHFASLGGNKAIVSHLIEMGANVHDSSLEWKTPLHFAARADNDAVAQVLINAGAGVDSLCRQGYTALMDALRCHSKAVVQFLLTIGAGIEVSSKRANPALMYASHAGHMAVVQYFLDRGAAINASGSDGTTALMHASLAGRTAVVQLLIDRKANINARSNRGKTALMFASEAGRNDVVQFLVRRKDTNVHPRDDMGRTALAWASLGGRRGLEEFSRKNGLEFSTEVGFRLGGLWKANKTNGGRWVAPVRILIENGGAEVDARDVHGYTPLILAAARGQRDLIQLLVQKGANTSARNNLGATAFDVALEGGHHELVQILEKMSSKASKV